MKSKNLGAILFSPKLHSRLLIYWTKPWIKVFIRT